jgi:cytochrome c biogenesis factor
MPALDLARVGEHLHGHLGWLAAIALVHPAIFLRRRDRRAHLSVALAVAMATLAGGLGASLYPAYRERLRQPIFAQAPGVGYLFERKEHLAFGAILLAWAGAVAYVAAHRYADAVGRDALRKAAHWAFVASALLGVVTALLGTIVASYRTF